MSIICTSGHLRVRKGHTHCATHVAQRQVSSAVQHWRGLLHTACPNHWRKPHRQLLATETQGQLTDRLVTADYINRGNAFVRF